MPATFMESDVLLMALCNVMRVAHDRESDQAAMSKKELTLAK